MEIIPDYSDESNHPSTNQSETLTITSTPTPTLPSSTAASSTQLQPPPLTQLFLSPAHRLVQLRTASEHWRVIALDSHRTEIDSQALLIVDEEERSVTARKGLAEQTKGFKKLDVQEQVAKVGPMVKAYQEEINALTKRAKSSEASFLTLYKLLHDAPDPYVLLSASLTELEKMNAMETKLKATETTLAEYETEFQGLKNQDVTVRNLERANQELLNSLEQRIQQAVQERASESAEQVEEARRAFAEQEKLLQTRIEALKEQLNTALSAQAQIHSAALSVDRRATEQAEMLNHVDSALLERELERAHADVAAKDRELIDLRAQLEAHSSHASAEEEAAQTVEANRLKEEIASLQSQLQAADIQVQTMQVKVNEYQIAAEYAQSQLASSEEKHQITIANLRREISELPNKSEFEELQRQLRFLHEMEYSSSSNTDSSPTTQSATPTTSSLASTAEQLLLSKTRRLENELTKLKVTHSELEMKHQSVTKEVDSLQAALTTARQLNIKLEEDLVQANSSMVHKLTQPSSGPSSLPHDFLRDSNVTTNLLTPAGAKVFNSIPATSSDSIPPSSEVLASFNADTLVPSTDAIIAVSTPAATTIASLQQQLSQSSSMLSIILQQRDRYRSKIDIIETQSNLLTNQVEKLKLDNAVLKKDNVQLYEKMQFLKSSYKSGNGGDIESGETHSSRSSSASSPPLDSEPRYAAIYEARLNPFAAFKQRAKAAREQALSTSERLTLAIGRTIFSKKLGRTFLFGYALVLHLLVMIVLWTHTVSPHCGGVGGAHGAHEH